MAAILCLHGLTSTPFEWRPLAETFTAHGHVVRTPRLVGHGTRPEVLQHTRWGDWLSSARHAFDTLADEHGSVFIIGASMGALCAIALAHERGARVAGVVLMATPLQLAFKSQLTVRVANKIPLAAVVPFIMKKGGPDVSDPAVAAAMPSYDRIPMASAASLLEGQIIARDRLPRLGCPVLVQHGRHDHVAPVSNAAQVMAALQTPHRRAIMYPRSWHILSLDVEHERVISDALAFITDPAGFAGGRAGGVKACTD
jgi:carboxylesterase